MRNPICFILFCIFMIVGGGQGATKELLEQVRILENFRQIELNTLVDAIRTDLLSNDDLLQDAGCIILLKLLERLKENDRRAISVFNRMSDDKAVVNRAAEIIDARLPGWYAGGKTIEMEMDDLIIYTPLFFILGSTHYKNARGTLLRSLLYLHERKNILKGIPLNDELVSLSLKKLRVINKKLCCVYPGKEPVVSILEHNTRSSMLSLFKGKLLTDGSVGLKLRKEINEFVDDCLLYGNSKYGHTIRLEAVEVAAILVKQGESDLLSAIEKLSKNDPYFIHSFHKETGYSMTDLRYPVREVCVEVIRHRDAHSPDHQSEKRKRAR